MSAVLEFVRCCLGLTISRSGLKLSSMFFDCEHRVMRRLLALWLLVSLLGYGSLLAMDLHGVDFAGDPTGHHPGPQSAGIAAAVVDSVVTDLAADQAVDSACDHCCHGISHLIGLSGADILIAYSLDARAAGSRSVALISRTLSPDLRPPIA